MIPRGYPQVPVRVKIGLAPWFALAVIGLGVLSDHGVIELHAAPPTTTRPAARGASSAPPPSRAARAQIPADYLALYRASARSCPGLPWGVLAGIGKVETNHGRSGAVYAYNHAGWYVDQVLALARAYQAGGDH